MMTSTPRQRSKVVQGHTHKVITGCGNLYVTVNRDEKGLIEVFTHLGKTGQCGAAQTEAICRVVSVALRSDVEPEVLVKQLKGIRCPSQAIDNGVNILSCADAIAHVIEEEIKEETHDTN